MTFDVEAFLSERQTYEESCKIVMKARLVEEIDRLQDDLKQARRLDERENRVPQAPGIVEEINQLREEMEESSKMFKFGELPRHQYEKTISDHPPRKVDTENGAVWNAESFPPALIARASVDPKLSDDDAKKLWEGLPFGEARRMFMTALAPQGKAATVPLAVSGIGSTPTTAQKSTTPPPEGSPEASS